MERASKRGKIPQSDWPLIMARYDAGETLASIARTYDCSPPAISYVVSKSRARQPAPDNSPKPPTASEPQLIKAAPNEAVAAAQPQVPEVPERDASGSNVQPQVTAGPLPPPREAGPVAPPAAHRDENPPRDGNRGGRHGGGERTPNPASPAPRPMTPPWYRPPAVAPQVNGDNRRTLHLSLGSPPNGNGSQHGTEPQPVERPNFANRGQPAQPPADRGPDSVAVNGSVETRRAAHHEPGRRADGDAGHRKEGGAFIDQELRARVEGDIAAFLAAFDAALVQDTMESRSALREATDRLLRAGARTRIELERLEARLPLPTRGDERGNPAWRGR